MDKMGYYNTFVVRIWCDDSRELNKGYVQHIYSQEQKYFLDMDDLKDFILAHLSPPIDDLRISNQTLGRYPPSENPGDIMRDG